MSNYEVLYYPEIDIENEQWLKSSLLYWDKIYTIVPRKLGRPYDKTISSQLYEEGILSPFIVHSRMRSCPPFIDLKDEMWQSMLHKFYNAT